MTAEAEGQASAPRVALVTGGTSGIGAAIAAQLAADGMRVAVVGLPQDNREFTAQVVDDGLVIRTDITAAGAPSRIVEEVVQTWGRLDVLVNNAGRRHAGTILECEVDDIIAVLTLNTAAAMAMAAAAARVMVNQQDGAIINITSRLASVGVPTLTTYSAAKGALLAYTRGAAVELAPHNIRVNAVAPGMAMTPLIEDWLADQAEPEQAIADVVADVPLGRLATAEDVAAVVSFLASKAAAYLTGASIPVDGGYTAR